MVSLGEELTAKPARISAGQDARLYGRQDARRYGKHVRARQTAAEAAALPTRNVTRSAIGASLAARTQQPFQGRGADLFCFARETREIFASFHRLVLRLRQRKSFGRFAAHPCPAGRTEGKQRGQIAILRAAGKKIGIAKIENVAEAEAACVEDHLIDGLAALRTGGSDPGSCAVETHHRQPSSLSSVVLCK